VNRVGTNKYIYMEKMILTDGGNLLRHCDLGFYFQKPNGEFLREVSKDEAKFLNEVGHEIDFHFPNEHPTEFPVWKFLKNVRVCNDYSNYISSARRLKLFDVDRIHELNNLLKKARKNYQNYLEIIANKPRRDACIFTANIDVKDIIYGMYGKKCLACGSEKNISLDHIVPIHKKGTNTIDNLQPLCKSCNSKKGTKVIDYRKEFPSL